MRKTLYLLRHAKTEAHGEGGQDHARRLTADGEAAAGRIGAWLAEYLPADAAVVCSTATRARQTWQLAAEAGKLPHSAVFEERLYLASPGELLMLAQALPETAATALFVGHNPGLHLLTLMLGEEGDARDSEIRVTFPTGAIAVVSWEGRWSEAGALPGRLERYIRP